MPVPQEFHRCGATRLCIAWMWCVKHSISRCQLSKWRQLPRWQLPWYQQIPFLLKLLLFLQWKDKLIAHKTNFKVVGKVVSVGQKCLESQINKLGDRVMIRIASDMKCVFILMSQLLSVLHFLHHGLTGKSDYLQWSIPCCYRHQMQWRWIQEACLPDASV